MDLEENKEEELMLDEAEEEVVDKRNAKEKIYDKIPLTYKQVDILTKVLIGLFGVLLVYFVMVSGGRG